MTEQPINDLREAHAELDALGIPRNDAEDHPVSLAERIRDAFNAVTASAPVDGDEIVANAPEQLKALGSRLADLLDADQWNNIEPLLLDIGRMLAPLATCTAYGKPCGYCSDSGDDQNNLNDPGPCHYCDGTGVVPAISILSARTPETDADVVTKLKAIRNALVMMHENVGERGLLNFTALWQERFCNVIAQIDEVIPAANLLRAPAVGDK